MRERALAHKPADDVEAAYQRGDMLQKRAAMMNDWANFCDELRSETITDTQVRMRGTKLHTGATS